MNQLNEKEFKELVCAFHLTWDKFPGPARLIDKENHVLAVNQVAEEAGLTTGQICAKVGAPESHKGCRKALTLSSQKAQMDRPTENKIRAWLPIEGYPDLVVHFSISLPEWNQDGTDQ